MNNLLAIIYLTFLCGSLFIAIYSLIRQMNKERKTLVNDKLLQQKIKKHTLNHIDSCSVGINYMSKKLVTPALIYLSYSLRKWNTSDLSRLTNLYNFIGFMYSENGGINKSIYYYTRAKSIIANNTL